MDVIQNKLNTINLENSTDNDNFQLDSYVKIIDERNINEMIMLANYNSHSIKNKKDIVYEMYDKNLLTFERLKFLVDNCTKYLNISSSLFVKRLIKEDNIELFNIIFDKLNFFDNKFIMNTLLYHYKSRLPVSTTNLNHQISKYKYSRQEGIPYNTCTEYFFDACRTGNENIVKFLIEHGININEKRKRNENTPLLEACECENENIVKYLIEHGADTNKGSWDGITPLFYACKYGNEKLFNYLVEHEADINKEDCNGTTPLFNACENGNENIFNYLVEHGADINKENDRNETPLFRACKNENENIVKYLVENGADINKENYCGETPLFRACEYGNDDIVKYLIDHGADINKEDWDHKTPLFYAYESGVDNIVNYLYEHGAENNEIIASEYENGNQNIVNYSVYGRFK